MNARLQQFIQAENLSQSQFADAIGVARASISHILAGRNKPGFDFIESMARHFPALNLEWLITGKGRMYKDSSLDAGKPDVVPAEILQAVEYEEDDLFSPANMGRNVSQPIIPGSSHVMPGNPSVMPDNPHVMPGNPSVMPDNPHVMPDLIGHLPANDRPSVGAKGDGQPVIAGPTGNPASPAAATMQVIAGKRSISKIIVLYDDNTFQELK